MKAKLLKEMNNWVEWEAQEICYILKVPKEDEINNLSFKPGISDKFLFNQMIKNLPNNILYNLSIIEDKEVDTFKQIGRNILHEYYYPNYSWWDEKMLNEARDKKY